MNVFLRCAGPGILSLLLCCVSIGCRENHTQQGAAPVKPLIEKGKLQIFVPVKISAGTSVSVRVRAAAPNGTPIGLVALTAYGPRPMQSTFVRGEARFQLPSGATARAGLITLSATSPAGQGQTSLRVVAGEAAIIKPLVGGRSVIADGAHASMVVAAPIDSRGNPVENDTPVRVLARHPDGVMQDQIVGTKNLLAWLPIYSRTRAGRTFVTVQSGKARGPEASFQEVAGWPRQIALSKTTSRTAVADGKQLLTLRTETIRDRYGNIMPGGTLLNFVVRDVNGTRRIIPAQTIDGVAKATLQAPMFPGVLSVRAEMFGVQSAPLQIRFTPGPAVGKVPFKILFDNRDGLLELRIGPLLGPMGGYIPDGTPVEIALQHGRARIYGRAFSDLGHAIWQYPLYDLKPGRYRIVVIIGAGKGESILVVPERRKPANQ